MDTRTFIVELVKALAWPITTLIILLLLRKQLVELLRSLRRFKYGDAEAEFAEGLKEVAPQVPASAAVEAAKREAVHDIVSPELAVLDAWASVERAVIDLAKRAGIPSRTFQEAFRSLREKAALSDKDYDAVNGLRALRNLVAHREEPSLSKQKAAEYLAMADAVKMLLEQAARKT